MSMPASGRVYLIANEQSFRGAMHPLLSSTPKTGPADPLMVSSVQQLTDPAKKIRT